MADDMHSESPPVKVLIATLRTRGVDAEAILIAVEALLDSLPRVTNGVSNGVTYNAKKQAEYRARKKAAAVTRVGNALPNPLPTRTRAGGVVSSSTKVDSGKKDNRATPREALETVLDPDRAAAVIDHRQRLRKPLTPYAARLLAGRLSKCPDCNAAADKMIEKGWQSIEPEWLENGTATEGEVLYEFSTVEEGYGE